LKISTTICFMLVFCNSFGQKLFFRVIDYRGAPTSVTILVKSPQGQIKAEIQTDNDGAFLSSDCCDLNDIISVKSDRYYVVPVPFGRIGAVLQLQNMDYSNGTNMIPSTYEQFQPFNKYIPAEKLKSRPNTYSKKSKIIQSDNYYRNKSDQLVDIQTDVDVIIFINEKRNTSLKKGNQATLTLGRNDSLIKVVSIANKIVRDSVFLNTSNPIKSIKFNLNYILVDLYNRSVSAFNSAFDFYKAKKYKEAIDSLKIASYCGNSTADAFIGTIYMMGDKATQNIDSAVKYFLNSYNNGNESVSNNVAFFYLYGIGVQKDARRGLSILKLSADKGDTVNMLNLANCYLFGLGVAKNEPLAIKYYMHLVRQGNAQAEYLMGQAYANGLGVKKDSSEAYKWYLKAADQGYVFGVIQIFLYYFNGGIVKRNDSLAYIYIKRAADTRSPNAEFCLGYYFWMKKHPDLMEAFKWIKLAKEDGSNIAESCLGSFYFNGWGVPKNDTLAFKCFISAANKNDNESKRNLGAMYINGWGVPKDTTEGIKWLLEAASKNDTASQVELGYIYMAQQKYSEALLILNKANKNECVQATHKLGYIYAMGLGTRIDQKEAFRLYQQAARKGYPYSQHNLGVIYHQGEGVPKNDSLAIYWFREAAAGGDSTAQLMLFQMCYFANGTIKNDSLAAHWLTLAANAGIPLAEYNLGIFYRDGTYFQKDDPIAFSWFHKSAKSGYAHAENQLGKMYMYGKGVNQSDSLAGYWFKLAAEQGVIEAIGYYGLLIYESRIIFDGNRQEGLKLLKTAAESRLEFKTYLRAHSLE
jgi:TPR repeat protein